MSNVPGVSRQIPPAPFYRRRQLLRRAGLIALVVVVVVAGAVFALLNRQPSLTDSADAFDESLSDIMGRIRAENEAVVTRHPDEYKTVLVLLPMSGDASTTGMGLDTVRHALQGSYLAQVWRNKEDSASPYIRLLVGDISPGAWEETVEDVLSQVESERLVAAVGLGASIDATKQVIERLSTDKFAMVAAVLTSDELQKHDALVRVAPLNSDQAEASVRFAVKAIPALKPVIVMDTNPGDSYSRTLSASFDRTLAGVVDARRRAQPLTFDSSVKASGTVIGNIAESVCNSESNTVFYAGRALHLPALLRGLSLSRRCAERGINVIAGDDTSENSHPVANPIWNDSSGKIRLYYTALAHSANISDGSSAVLAAIKSRFGNGDDRGYVRLFPEETLDDGQAIMHHDALYVAIKAIDRYAKERLESLGPPEVAAMLRSGTISVQGASGDISIDRDGNPSRQSIPVLELTPYGRTTFATWASPVPSGDPGQ
ncbi:hypothetical protein [Nonomuraea zeae]|uniref:Uncharacterized protein n=1 Tax=Nonomuraea zeae TaxID=1642303 RepID=A0A5S4HC52_9ACTN|nr:hypothetical protein [Nonomuraea zeae]TMR36460.1 hypothetical protein ETD85_10755 [Nonomuraea zeae]